MFTTLGCKDVENLLQKINLFMKLMIFCKTTSDTQTIAKMWFSYFTVVWVPL